MEDYFSCKEIYNCSQFYPISVVSPKVQWIPHSPLTKTAKLYTDTNNPFPSRIDLLVMLEKQETAGLLKNA